MANFLGAPSPDRAGRSSARRERERQRRLDLRPLPSVGRRPPEANEQASEQASGRADAPKPRRNPGRRCPMPCVPVDPEMLPKGYRDNRKHDAKTLRTRYTIDQDRRTIEPAPQPHRAQASVPNSRPLTPSKPRTPATPFAGIRRHPIYGCADVRFERIERLKRIEPRRKTTDPSREGRSSRRSGRSFFRTTRFRLLRTCRFEFSADRLDSDR